MVHNSMHQSRFHVHQTAPDIIVYIPRLFLLNIKSLKQSKILCVHAQKYTHLCNKLGICIAKLFETNQLDIFMATLSVYHV